MAYSKLHPIAFGVSIAALSSASTLLVCFFANMLFGGKPLVAMLGSMYISYNPSILNSVLAAILVFVNVLIGGYIAAWIYNFLAEYI
jgi:hypothetical protein